MGPWVDPGARRAREQALRMGSGHHDTHLGLVGHHLDRHEASRLPLDRLPSGRPAAADLRHPRPLHRPGGRDHLRLRRGRAPRLGQHRRRHHELHLLYLRDLHGDILGTVQAGASTPSSRAYQDPWGGLSWSGTPPLLGFQSELTDPATGAVATPARWYLPTLARFMAPDPLEGDPALPTSLNRLAYAADDPVTLWDPTGLLAAATQETGGKPCGRACADDGEDPGPGEDVPGGNDGGTMDWTA